MSNLYFKFLDYLISRSPFLCKPLPSQKGPRDSFTNAVNLASDVVRLVLKRVPHIVPALVLKKKKSWAPYLQHCVGCTGHCGIHGENKLPEMPCSKGAAAARETTRIS